MEKGKIEAYTLMEIAVAMLLAGICISICYTAYGLIGDYFNAFEKKNRNAQQVLSLHRAMRNDIQRALLLLRTDDGIAVYRDSLTVRYHFETGMLSREVEGLRTDSFVLAPIEIDFRFEGRESLKGDTVDMVSFVTAVGNGGKVPFVINKFYSAQDLFR